MRSKIFLIILSILFIFSGCKTTDEARKLADFNKMKKYEFVKIENKKEGILLSKEKTYIWCKDEEGKIIKIDAFWGYELHENTKDRKQSVYIDIGDQKFCEGMTPQVIFVYIDKIVDL